MSVPSSKPASRRVSRAAIRTHAQVDAIEVMLRSYSAEVQAALDWCNTELAIQHDGFTASVNGAGTPTAVRSNLPSGPCQEASWRVEGHVCGLQRPCPDHDAPVELTSVEAAADRRRWLEQQHDQMEDDIKTLGQILLSARRVAQMTMGQRLVHRSLDGHEERCNRGGRRDGSHVWGDPLCERIADPTKAGMCDVCWEAERAWREETGRPRRRRTGATDPDDASPLCVRPGCTNPATPGRSDGLCDADRMRESRARRKQEAAADA